MRLPVNQQSVEFLLNIQSLLTKGQFTATYKFALLLAIADICVEKGHDELREFEIGLRDIAEKFISYYWGHARIYRDDRPLRSNTKGQAFVVSTLSRAQGNYPTLVSLRENHRQWHGKLNAVVHKIKEDPLVRLQTIGGVSREFIYTYTDGADHIVLKAGVSSSFRLFHGLITELVRSTWTEFIRKIPENRELIGQFGDLEEFLFGEQRHSLAAYKNVLIELQDRRCFYCGRSFNDSCEVDHFIPWSVYRRDLGHNFVLADRRCNAQKSSQLAATGHLEKWVRRNLEHSSELESAFAKLFIPHDLTTSLSVAEHAYKQAMYGNSFLWLRGREFESVDERSVRVINCAKREFVGL